MNANRSMIVRSGSGGGGGGASTVAIDVFDEVPDPGDAYTVYLQVVDAQGNGVAAPGATIVIALAGAGAASGTLTDTTLTSDANGRATTTLTIAGGAAAGTRMYVNLVSVTIP